MPTRYQVHPTWAPLDSSQGLPRAHGPLLSQYGRPTVSVSLAAQHQITLLGPLPIDQVYSSMRMSSVLCPLQ